MMFTLLNVMIVMNDSLPKKPWSIYNNTCRGGTSGISERRYCLNSKTILERVCIKSIK